MIINPPQWLWLILRVSAVAYGTLFAYAIVMSDRQIYLPPARSLPVVSGGLTLTTPSGTAISALYWPAPPPKGQAQMPVQTLLYSHGNAEDLFGLQNTLAAFQTLGFGVFAYDYPGYGQSAGKPSERGVYEAIDTAYRYLTVEQKIPPAQILVYGRSLGGGPSVDLAAREPIGGLILDATFVSIYRVVTRIPLVPLDKFRNLAKIPNVQAPVLIFHGTEDTTIPLWHSQALYDAVTFPLKQIEIVEGAGHNDLQEVMGDRFWQVFKDFSQTVRGSFEV